MLSGVDSFARVGTVSLFNELLQCTLWHEQYHQYIRMSCAPLHVSLSCPPSLRHHHLSSCHQNRPCTEQIWHVTFLSCRCRCRWGLLTLLHVASDTCCLPRLPSFSPSQFHTYHIYKHRFISNSMVQQDRMQGRNSRERLLSLVYAPLDAMCRKLPRSKVVMWLHIRSN